MKCTMAPPNPWVIMFSKTPFPRSCSHSASCCKFFIWKQSLPSLYFHSIRLVYPIGSAAHLAFVMGVICMQAISARRCDSIMHWTSLMVSPWESISGWLTDSHGLFVLLSSCCSNKLPNECTGWLINCASHFLNISAEEQSLEGLESGECSFPCS